MYKEQMVGICKIENGFIIEVRASWKEEKDEGDDKCCCMVSSREYGEKEIYAKDATDLAKKVEAIIPLLQTDIKSKDAFDAAFSVLAEK
jgi:hypothetical protein